HVASANDIQSMEFFLTASFLHVSQNARITAASDFREGQFSLLHDWQRRFSERVLPFSFCLAVVVSVWCPGHGRKRQAAGKMNLTASLFPVLHSTRRKCVNVD